MTIMKKPYKSQFFIFLLGMIIFTISAGFGWHKLQYGFNFIDEGYHATESWRLSTGDHFLEDKITGALMHYTLISSIIFKIHPEISLLQLRQIQFIATLISLVFFGFMIFRQDRNFYWIPFVLSLFAFTGLDTTGMISNLYYQTYPHLFLLLYLSFMLLGIKSENTLFKRIAFISSGLCLWAISLSLLYLSIVILAPILLYAVIRKIGSKEFHLSLKDLLYIMFPFVICWIMFIAAFNKDYFSNLYNSISVILSMSSYSKGLINLSGEVITHIAISTVYLFAFFISLKKLPVRFSILTCTFFAVVMFTIIQTSLFGFLAPYYNGLFGKPMWFSSFLMAFTLSFWLYMFLKYLYKSEYDRGDELSLILMIPFTICSLTMSIFSGLGSLSTCQTAIPAVSAMIIMMTYQLNRYRIVTAIVAVMLMLGPFYFFTAKHDWEFTFFDLQPGKLDVEITSGFGKGIRTNQLYAKLYDWLIENAETYTKADDFSISYIVSSMTHMITRRRPSLDDTFITFAKSEAYFRKDIETMKQNGREPRIAFIFERMPILFPTSPDSGTVTFPNKQFDFITSQDPISRYVKTHMTLVSEFKISDDHIIRCLVDKKRFEHK